MRIAGRLVGVIGTESFSGNTAALQVNKVTDVLSHGVCDKMEALGLLCVESSMTATF